MSSTIARAIERHRRCTLALSGGSTPRALFRRLASDFRTEIPWQNVHVFWGDERFVAETDPASNFGTAKTTLLDHVPCPAGNIHPIPTHLDTAAAAADAYAAELRAYFGEGWPRFNLILLGIGEDCHTASLFPHSPALSTHDRIVTAVQPVGASGDAVARITLTMPVLLAADTVFVLAAGARKAPALARVLAAGTTADDCPASALCRSNGAVTWWADRAAAPSSDRMT